MKRVQLCVAAAIFSLTAMARNVELLSPDGAYRLTFRQEKMEDGALSCRYDVEYDGMPVITDSRLGLELDNRIWEQALARHIERGALWMDNLELDSVSYASHAETYRPLFGERSTVENNYNEAIAYLSKKDGSNYRMNIEMRAFNEGVAFRFYFPEHLQAIFHKVVDDFTEYTFPEGTMAWHAAWAQAPYHKMPLQGWTQDSERALLLELPNGVYAALADADVDDWAHCKFRLSETRANTVRNSLYGVVDMVTDFASPWHIVMAGKTPGEIVENNEIINNLNPPCAIPDAAEWVRPGKIMRETTLTTANAIKCIDFCAAHNMQYILFDWKWYGKADTYHTDATKIVADIDIRKVTSYAHDRGIGVFMYVNHHAIQNQAEELFPIMKSWGVDGIKFGFVQYMSHRWSTWLHDMVRLAAKNKLMVNIHDEYRPSGFSRTYPNLITQEGVRGNEEFPDATHNTITAFTRMINGAADYTICYYDRRVNNTHSHQLAASLVFYSPLQTLFWYDKPDMYKGEPEVEWFEELPTVFDESHLDGKPGEYALSTRRHGDDWYMGLLANNDGSEHRVPLSFLASGKKYLAKIYTDDDRVETRTHVACRYLLVDSKSVLKLDLKPRGGVAVHFVPVDARTAKNYKKYKGQTL